MVIRRTRSFSETSTTATACNVISLADSGTLVASVNYPLYDKLGAAAVVQAFLAPNSLHVIVHDVGGRKVAQVRDFAVPSSVGSPDWRLAIHGASDELNRLADRGSWRGADAGLLCS